MSLAPKGIWRAGHRESPKMKNLARNFATRVYFFKNLKGQGKRIKWKWAKLIPVELNGVPGFKKSRLGTKKIYLMIFCYEWIEMWEQHLLHWFNWFEVVVILNIYIYDLEINLSRLLAFYSLSLSTGPILRVQMTKG